MLLRRFLFLVSAGGDNDNKDETSQLADPSQSLASDKSEFFCAEKSWQLEDVMAAPPMQAVAAPVPPPSRFMQFRVELMAPPNLLQKSTTPS